MWYYKPHAYQHQDFIQFMVKSHRNKLDHILWDRKKERNERVGRSFVNVYEMGNVVVAKQRKLTYIKDRGSCRLWYIRRQVRNQTPRIVRVTRTMKGRGWKCRRIASWNAVTRGGGEDGGHVNHASSSPNSQFFQYKSNLLRCSGWTWPMSLTLTFHSIG